VKTKKPAEFRRNIKEADAGFARLFEEPEYADGRMFIAHGVELINRLLNDGERDKADYIEWFMRRTLRRRRARLRGTQGGGVDSGKTCRRPRESRPNR
jgi:hypothetical protein